MNITDRLYIAAEINWMESAEKPFPLEMAEGTLDDSLFKNYMIAQETTLYGIDLYQKRSLPDLLDALNEIPGLLWIRILYCYPEENAGTVK